MKEHPQVIRMHHRTAPYWARLRRVIEKRDQELGLLGERLKDIEVLDRAIHAALIMLDPDPANEGENSIMLSLDAPVYIIPEDGEPKGKWEPVRSATPEEEEMNRKREREPARPRPPEDPLTARLEKLEANVKTLMEKNE